MVAPLASPSLVAGAAAAIRSLQDGRATHDASIKKWKSRRRARLIAVLLDIF